MRTLAAIRNLALLVLAIIVAGGVLLQPHEREARVPTPPPQLARL